MAQYIYGNNMNISMKGRFLCATVTELLLPRDYTENMRAAGVKWSVCVPLSVDTKISSLSTEGLVEGLVQDRSVFRKY